MSNKTDKQKVVRRKRSALTPEARENQMISLAIDVAEQQLMSGKASSQVITHYLKLGSMKERLEMERIKNENELLRAKVADLQSKKRTEELYADAIKAMKMYSGNGEEYYDDEDIY